MLHRIWIAAGLFSTLAACKTTSEGTRSEVESLDMFIDGAKAEACVGEPTAEFDERYDLIWEKKGIIADEGYKKPLRPIMAAIPTGFMQWYFLNGGTMQIIGKPASYCPEGRSDSVNLYSAVGSVTGCVRFPNNGQQSSMPKMYIGVEGNTIASQAIELSAAVQAFGVVFGSFLSELGTVDTSNASDTITYDFGKNDDEMKNDKVSLAFLLLDDLVISSESAAKLPENYRHLVRSSVALDKSQSRDARWAAVWKLHKSGDENFKKFQNAVLAHTFESALCRSSAALTAKDSPVRQTAKYYLDNMHGDIVESFQVEPLNASTSSPATVTNSSASDSSVTAAATTTSLSLTRYYRFPLLRGIIRAPFAIAAYFIENRPVRTFFATHKPVRRAAVAVFRGGARIVGGVGRVVFPGDRCWRLRRRLC